MTIEVQVDTSALTEIQLRVFNILRDGECHKPAELRAVIDSQADGNTLGWHISNLRSKLYEQGLLIAAHSQGKAGTSGYQLVQRLRVRID